MTLLDNIALTETVVINENLTLDLNGKNIAAADARALWVKAGDVAITGTGTITSTKTEGSSLVSGSSVIRVGDSGAAKAKLTIGSGVTVDAPFTYGVTVFGTNADGVELVVNGKVESHGTEAAISGNGNTGNKGAVTINEGAVVTAENAEAIYHPQGDALTINGGTITGATAVYVKSGTVAISGGALTGNGAAAAYSPTGDDCNPTGDALVVDNCAYPGNAPSVSISGGTFASTNGKGIGSYYSGSATGLAVVTANSNLITIPDDETWVPEGEGYKLVKAFTVTWVVNDATAETDENVKYNTAPSYDGAAHDGAAPAKTADASGVYTFDGWTGGTVTTPTAVAGLPAVTATVTYTAHFASVEPVAKIGDNYYATLKDAVDAAQAGDTVTLVADSTADAAKTAAEDRTVVAKKITIDFGAYTYSVPGSLEPTANWAAIYVDSDATFKGTTGGIRCLDKDGGAVGVYAINVRNGANLKIEGGRYHGGGTVVQAQEGTVEITGGEFTLTPFEDPYGSDFALNCKDANYQAGTAKFDIKGGTFVGFDPQDNKSEGEHTDFTADGYVAIEDPEGTWVVQEGWNVTFDANGGTPEPEAQRVKKGDKATEPQEAPEKAADASGTYTFLGWFASADAETAFDFAVAPTTNLTLTARYSCDEVLNEFVYPIENTAGVPMNREWLAQYLPDDIYSNATQTIYASMTNAMVQALSANGANGVPMWQSYVLGFDPTDPNANLRLTASPKSATEVTIKGLNVVLIQDNIASNVSVTFRLAARNDDGTWTNIRTGSTTPEFNETLKSVAGKVLAIFADITVQ